VRRVAGVSMGVPSMAIRRSSIIRSISRRDAMPARARSLAMRCGSPLTWTRGGSASARGGCAGPLGGFEALDVRRGSVSRRGRLALAAPPADRSGRAVRCRSGFVWERRGSSSSRAPRGRGGFGPAPARRGSSCRALRNPVLAPAPEDRSSLPPRLCSERPSARRGSSPREGLRARSALRPAPSGPEGGDCRRESVRWPGRVGRPGRRGPLGGGGRAILLHRQSGGILRPAAGAAGHASPSRSLRRHN
jgi:hypothetical protein